MSIFNTGKSLLKKVKAVPIFYTVNNEYMPYAACSIASLIAHTDPKRYYRIIILHDGITFRNYFRLRNLVTSNCEIQFRKMTHNFYLRTIIRHCSRRTGSGDFFSSAVYYYRAFIARLFPQYNKAIYIDSDTILTGDIAKLYDIELGENLIAALVDPKVSTIPEFRGYVENALGIPCEEYINSGVLLLNCKKLRKIHYISHMIELINQYDANLVAPDQDYLNLICRGQILHLDTCWNTEPALDLPTDTKLLHFNLFKKPWHYYGVACEELFWDAAKRTGFYNELLRCRDNFSIDDQRTDSAKIEALIRKAGRLAKVQEPLIKIEKL